MVYGTLAQRLAEGYARALEDLGMKVPEDGEGFERLLDDGNVRVELRVQLMKMDCSNNDSPGYIAQKLLKDAIIQYGERKQRSAEIAQIATVAGFYRTAFAARMGLWKRMVGAAHDGRIFTDVELECHTRLAKRRRKDLRAARANVSEDLNRRAQAVVDRELMDEHGLLFDRQMIADTDQLVGNALQKRPTLLVGDKGIAKTQLARFVASLYGHEPVLVSIKGDTRTSDLIGHAQAAAGDALYPEGPVPFAMREGIPVILDEINFGNQAIIARLHDILLRRPGDEVFFPELGEEIRVHPGFVVFATANEASSRYRQRQVLDPALRDRFEIIVRDYPDLDRDVVGAPHPSLSRMALASAIDDEGIVSRHVDPEMLEYYTDVAAMSERLYAIEAKRAARHIEDKGLLEGMPPDRPLVEECISPRTVCRTVFDSALGNLPGRNLDLFLIDRIVASLDQDGTTHNSDTVRAVALQKGINLYDTIPEDQDDEDDAEEDGGFGV